MKMKTNRSGIKYQGPMQVNENCWSSNKQGALQSRPAKPLRRCPKLETKEE